MLRAAFAQGARGLAADIAGYCLQPWGFQSEVVRAETLLLYGARDPLAEPRHGRWWESRLPDARLEIVPGAGHLLVIPMWARVLSHLAPDRAPLRLVDGYRHGAEHEDVEEFSCSAPWRDPSTRRSGARSGARCERTRGQAGTRAGALPRDDLEASLGQTRLPPASMPRPGDRILRPVQEQRFAPRSHGFEPPRP